jgi:alpha-glucosidase
VQDELLECARFWLERGVDGFRLDAVNYAMHDPQLRDNPTAPPDGRVRTRPCDFQLPLYNKSHPDIPLFIERIRRLVDGYGERFTVAEVGGANAEADMKSFTAGTQRFHSAYGFNFLLADRLTPRLVQQAVEAWPDSEGTGWPSWAFSNHDAPRAPSRWASTPDRAAMARVTMLLLACLRGNIFIYQGEELGLPQAQVPFEQLKDPEATARARRFHGARAWCRARTRGCRSPPSISRLRSIGRSTIRIRNSLSRGAWSRCASAATRC